MAATSINAYTPAQSLEICARIGIVKGHMRPDKVVLSSVMAGIQLAFASATLVTVNASPWFQSNAPGLIQVIAAAFFPYGLVMIVTSGCELTTSSFMYTTVPFLQRRLSIFRVLLHWVLTFLGNLAGSLFVVAIITGYGGTFDKGAMHDEAIAFAQKKYGTKWYQTFLLGIGANFLVCTACFLGHEGRDLVSRVVGIWWPTFAFVSLGMDHVVANMFFIPAGIWQHAPGISVGGYIGNSMVPTALGNIVGGALFVGVWFWYLHMSHEPPISVDGLEYVPLGSSDDVPQQGTDGSVNRKLQRLGGAFVLRKLRLEGDKLYEEDDVEAGRRVLSGSDVPVIDGRKPEESASRSDVDVEGKKE